jgi:methionine biosynthesis protein MetW
MEKIKKTIHKLIAQEIPSNSRVLDLGCGDGVLLDFLISNKNVIGHGVDIDSKALINCIEKGIPVIQLDLNHLPLDFPDNSFDIVVLNQTIQEMRHPDKIILEMLRIGKQAILGFPNFGSCKIRFNLLFNGRMPTTKELPYNWYDTPNIHLLTIKDFYNFCKLKKINISKKIFLRRKPFKKKEKFKNYKKTNFLPNLFADLSVFVINKK